MRGIRYLLEVRYNHSRTNDTFLAILLWIVKAMKLVASVEIFVIEGTMNNLKVQLHEVIEWLTTQLSFEILEDIYFAELFGNALMTLRRANILIRFVDDRGSLLLLFASGEYPDAFIYFADFEKFAIFKSSKPRGSAEFYCELIKLHISNLDRYFLSEAYLVSLANWKQQHTT